jgi:hypothetical protein
MKAKPQNGNGSQGMLLSASKLVALEKLGGPKA